MLLSQLKQASFFNESFPPGGWGAELDEVSRAGLGAESQAARPAGLRQVGGASGLEAVSETHHSLAVSAPTSGGQ